MTTQDADNLESKISKFRELQAEEKKLYAAIENVSASYSESPFTGNWREARRVTKLHLYFSGTNGGAPSTDVPVPISPGIDAFELSNFLKEALTRKLHTVQKHMKEL